MCCCRCCTCAAFQQATCKRRSPPCSGRGRTKSLARRATRLKAGWQEEFERWKKRDLSARRYVYIWADGVYLQARMEPDKQCILVIIGTTPEGKKELIGFQAGYRESAQSWRELLADLKARGLAVPPELATGDATLGFWKALEEIRAPARLGAQDRQCAE
jgi:transposase-like protein